MNLQTRQIQYMTSDTDLVICIMSKSYMWEFLYKYSSIILDDDR